MPGPGGNNEVISCVCVTKGDPALLKRSMACFRAQSYRNTELVIVFETGGDDHLSLQWAEGPGVRLVPVSASPRVSLGELRNTGIRAASGQLICQWDDDDWHHADRLKDQYAAMLRSGRNGSILSRWTVFDSVHQRAFISNKRLWEGSVLCRKSILQAKPYADKHLGEDTDTIDYLASRGELYVMDAAPALYIYIYHGSNTWHYAHWKNIFACSRELPAPATERISRILTGEYQVGEDSMILDEALDPIAIYS